MKNEIIPRNLNEPDTFTLGMGLKIRFLDLPLLFSGSGLGCLIGNTILDFYNRNKVICCELAINEPKEKLVYYIIIGGFTIVFFILTRVKIENQHLTDLFKDFIIFSGRKLIYRKENAKWLLNH